MVQSVGESVEEVIESVYQAAALPELWPDALERLSRLAGGAAGSLVAYSASGNVGHISSQGYRAAYDDYLVNGTQFENVRPRRVLERNHAGFLADHDVCTLEELEEDVLYNRFLRPHGLQWTAGTVVVSPSGDMLVIDVANARGSDPFTREGLDRLDLVRPHLARAALLASRLGLRAANDMTAALGMLGLPAMAVSQTGKIVAMNELAERLDDRFVVQASDKLALRAASANDLLQSGLQQSLASGTVRSIPLAADRVTKAAIIHVVPIRGAARDIFASATAIVLVTTVADKPLISVDLIMGLFDLTPAESRVARSLASGYSIEQTAVEHNVSTNTVRNQLRSVFAKTGMARQAELVGLLRQGMALSP